MKRMKLLVGYDGSNYADVAIADLKRAGLPRKTNIHVLSAAEVLLPKGPEIKIPKPIRASILRSREAVKRKMQEATQLSAQARKKIQSMFPEWTVQNSSCEDSAAWGIIKKSESWKPDFIVVGAHGHSGLGRFLGSVSQMILLQAKCSVRIGRHGTQTKRKFPRLLIGIDGSTNSAAAVQAVARRSWPIGTEILLLSVMDSAKPTFIDQLAMLESYSESLREKGMRVCCKVEKGNPKHVLLREAKLWKANCIFVGARGLTRVKRLLMGGVSTAVAARAHCSVEVIRQV